MCRATCETRHYPVDVAPPREDSTSCGNARRRGFGLDVVALRGFSFGRRRFGAFPPARKALPAMFFLVPFALFVLSGGVRASPPFAFPVGYRNYHEMTAFLVGLVQNYSDFASLRSIGRSVEGRELWALRIKAPNSPILGAPNVKFVGNIHGNEPVGRELILRFAEHLLENYETDPEVKWILDRTVVYLLPSLNPDGFERSREGTCHSGPGRENGNFVDLNRSFPDHFHENRIPLQPETLAIAQWMSEVPFLLSASFHGGALVANYPFDSSPENERELLYPRSSLTPDDDVFRHLARTYADGHPTMHKGRTCNENHSFPGGITNGAAWYSFAGGMQDYNYVSQGCMELTLEISCCKYPQAEHLPRLWAENKRAMLELAKQSQMGVRGLILDKTNSAQIPGAVLRISGRAVPFASSKNGEFWRMLLPGSYVLTVEAAGYETQSFPFTVDNANATHPTSTWLNVYLRPADDLLGSASLNVVEAVKSSSGRSSASLLVSPCFPLLFYSLFG